MRQTGPVPVCSMAATYSVAAGNYTTGYANYGTYGCNYVMSNPTVSQVHVSSIYVIDSRGTSYNMAEAGWVKCPPNGATSPTFFAAWVDNGTYGEYNIGSAPQGTNHGYKVLNVIGNNKWRYYVDGVQKKERTYSTLFRNGSTVCSSERNSLTGDTNYSHFWSLRCMNSQGTWSDWSDLTLFGDNDPNYSLTTISDTECYMQNP